MCSKLAQRHADHREGVLSNCGMGHSHTFPLIWPSCLHTCFGRLTAFAQVFTSFLDHSVTGACRSECQRQRPLLKNISRWCGNSAPARTPSAIILPRPCTGEVGESELLRLAQTAGPEQKTRPSGRGWENIVHANSYLLAWVHRCFVITAAWQGSKRLWSAPVLT